MPFHFEDSPILGRNSIIIGDYDVWREKHIGKPIIIRNIMQKMKDYQTLKQIKTGVKNSVWKNMRSKLRSFLM